MSTLMCVGSGGTRKIRQYFKVGEFGRERTGTRDEARGWEGEEGEEGVVAFLYLAGVDQMDEGQAT
jgi:hypothetical protein